ncbi:hypothetical protein ABE073_04500 [Lederbergia citrisecunda]|uniref:hypothetical protein n=1 Tax=Lederbergia citrisecunda TaxID=2833583 RepID=UPI003D2DC4D3
MGWFSKAAKSCEKRGYEVVNYNNDDEYIFLKKDGVIIPVTENGISKWIEEDKSIINQIVYNRKEELSWSLRR